MSKTNININCIFRILFALLIMNNKEREREGKVERDREGREQKRCRAHLHLKIITTLKNKLVKS